MRTEPTAAEVDDKPLEYVSSTGGSVPELIKQLADDVSTLMTKEVALAKSEFREAAGDVKKGVTGIIGGIALAFGGIVILLGSAVAGLSNLMSPWLASLLVGVTALAVGAILIKSGSSKVQPEAFIPERAIDSVKKDKDEAIARAKS